MHLSTKSTVNRSMLVVVQRCRTLCLRRLTCRRQTAKFVDGRLLQTCSSLAGASTSSIAHCNCCSCMKWKETKRTLRGAEARAHTPTQTHTAVTRNSFFFLSSCDVKSFNNVPVMSSRREYVPFMSARKPNPMITLFHSLMEPSYAMLTRDDTCAHTS